MSKEDYELLPSQEVESLKKEIDKLKKNPLGELPEGRSLLEAVEDLNTNIKRLIEIFVSTEADLAREYSDSSPAEDLKVIKDQNEQIAKGILTVADMLKEPKAQPEQTMQYPSAPQGYPVYPQSPSQQPVPDLGPPPELGPIPPVPSGYPNPYADATYGSPQVLPSTSLPPQKRGLFFRK